MFFKRVAITGLSGFTGAYLEQELKLNGYEVFPINSLLNDVEGITAELSGLNPDAIIHLAAQSMNFGANREITYTTNVIGTQDLLSVAASLECPPKKVIIASSSAVYGEAEGALQETELLAPVTHYGCSKLSMEFMAEAFANQFRLIITRPFNYTGRNQSQRFVIPKIVEAFRSRADNLRLGNLDSEREYNDVRDVARMYRSLLESDLDGRVVNLCSGEATSLRTVIKYLERLSGHSPKIIVDPALLRAGESKVVVGNPNLLIETVGSFERCSLNDTLSWMYLE